MAKEEKKVQLRDALAEFATQFFERDFGELNEKQRSEALTRFFISEVHNRTRNRISEDDIELGLVDGSKDLGVDFIHRDDGTVLIVQSKYSRRGGAVPLDDVLNFQSIFDRLLNARFEANSDLAERLAVIDFERDFFQLRFVTLGDITGQAAEQVGASLTLPIPGLQDRVDFAYLDASHLQEEVRTARQLGVGLPGSFTLHSAGSANNRRPIVSLDHGGYQTCVLVVDAQQLWSLYERYRDRLFILNIRNYLGNTGTNKLLAGTLRDEPESFFFYNNGIACLAEELRVEGDRVITEKLQVVNGAQTVRALYKAGAVRGSKPDLSKTLVLMRITEAKGYGKGGRFRESIVRYNNTQNIIKVSDFRSNDAIHEDLRGRFAEHKRFGRKVLYLPKRTDPQDTRDCEVVRLEDFAKVVFSFLRNPTSFSASTSFLFDDGEAGGYKDVFGNGKDIWEIMPDDEFKLRAAAWWLAVAYEARLKDDRQAATDPQVKNALERKWLLIYAARLVLERSYAGDSYKADLQRQFRGEWKFGEDRVGRWFEDIYGIAKEVLVYRYKEAAKASGFNHRNWMRSAETSTSLKDFVAEGPMRTVVPLKEAH